MRNVKAELNSIKAAIEVLNAKTQKLDELINRTSISLNLIVRQATVTDFDDPTGNQNFGFELWSQLIDKAWNKHGNKYHTIISVEDKSYLVKKFNIAIIEDAASGCLPEQNFAWFCASFKDELYIWNAMDECWVNLTNFKKNDWFEHDGSVTKDNYVFPHIENLFVDYYANTK